MSARPVRLLAAEALIKLPLQRAVESTTDFYDVCRLEYSEYSSRLMAQAYLRRKVPDLSANDAAVMLADALALRAVARVDL
jgi:hypothetical protein